MPPPAVPPEKEKSAPVSAPPMDAPPPAEPKAPVPRTPAEQLAEAQAMFAAGRNDEAVKLLKPLAESGNPRAQVLLGVAYAEGRGVERNLSTARDFYDKAAGAGDTDAMLKLGTMFKGVNNNLAYIWYATAAQLGSNAAKVERDRTAPLLQPAEQRQADRKVEEILQKVKRP
jgi:TPR repeat protein